MHYHLEIIIPPTDNIEEAIEQVMAPFNECSQNEDDSHERYGFYDYYVIGGRWNGAKVMDILGQDNIDKFQENLAKKHITVSSLSFGKQSLNPESQIPLVDDLWNETFPNSPIKVCPLFSHYKGDFGDVMKLKDIPENLNADSVIIAKPHWDNKGKLEAGYMVRDSIYNGTTWQDTKWDREVKSALTEYEKQLSNAREDYKKDCLPTPEWLCVTIDYHS